MTASFGGGGGTADAGAAQKKVIGKTQRNAFVLTHTYINMYIYSFKHNLLPIIW